MPRRERAHFVLDAEEPRDEVLEVRREREQELGFRFRIERCGVGARGAQPSREPGIGSLQEIDEVPVDPDESFPAVEILELESVGEGERGAQSRW